MENIELEPANFCSLARLPGVGLGCIPLSCWLRVSHGDL